MTQRSAVAVLALISVCLPALVAAQAFDGLTLYNTINNRVTYLKDNSGQTVNSWSCSNSGYMAYLLPDSTIWRMEVYSGATMRGAAYGGLMAHYDWDRNLLESFIWSNSYHQQHHDFYPMSNGNLLLVSWDRKTNAEAKALGRVTLTGDMWSEEIVEYDPVADSVVWEWHFWDHLIQDVDSTKPNYGVVAEHPELLDINLGTVQSGDWLHNNTVAYNEERDEVVITSHNLHEFWVVDHSTTTAEAAGHTGGRHGKGGDFLYRWGNPRNYDRGTTSDRVFYVVHGTNWIPTGYAGAGDLITLNNGDRSGSSGDSSSIVQITAPLDSNDHYYIHPDSAFGPTTPTWTYSDGRDFYSSHLGGAYRLPNGNTLATLGTASQLVEVTYAKQVVWTYNVGAQVPRASKYPRDFATGVSANPESRQLCRFESAAPNPFVHSTAIRYQLTSRAHVRLVVHDATGRVVRSMVDRAQDAGTYTAGLTAWSGLPAGVYFARIEATPVSGVQRQVDTRVLVRER